MKTIDLILLTENYIIVGFPYMLNYTIKEKVKSIK